MPAKSNGHAEKLGNEKPGGENDVEALANCATIAGVKVYANAAVPKNSCKSIMESYGEKAIRPIREIAGFQGLRNRGN